MHSELIIVIPAEAVIQGNMGPSFSWDDGSKASFNRTLMQTTVTTGCRSRSMKIARRQRRNMLWPAPLFETPFFG